MRSICNYGLRLIAASALLAIPTQSLLAADIRSASGDCRVGERETTPSSDFTLLEGGAVVRHETTGLEWRRCPEAMTWNGSNCTGTPSWMHWQAAMDLAESKSEWRLPNKEELQSIVECYRIAPSINQQIFPNTPSVFFWSASTYASGSDAWGVFFGTGSATPIIERSPGLVRLVRGGQ